MKLLLYTPLLLFILFISISASCDGGSSYSDCKNEGSDCCFVILDYDCKGRNTVVRQCMYNSKLSDLLKLIEKCQDKNIKQKYIQCASNSSNYLRFDLLTLIIFLYISIY
mgnify:CR=1 FL=1